MPNEVKKKEKKEKKHFLKDFKAELKKVIWPTPKQLVNNTVAVLTIVAVTAVIVFALDLGFEMMNTYGINKLKTVVESKNTIENTTSNNTESENNENSSENTQSGENNIEQSSNTQSAE